MRHAAVTLFAALLSFSIMMAMPALADDATAAKPSKESLLAAWEAVQKEDPYTVTFEGTKEKSVYNFETTIFPYKGKIKVLNLVIDKKPARYYDEYRDYSFDDPEEDYKGIVELELDGVDEKFQTKYRYSYNTWDRDNALHYNAKSSAWHTPKQWAEHRETLKDEAAPSKRKKTLRLESVCQEDVGGLVANVCLYSSLALDLLHLSQKVQGEERGDTGKVYGDC